MDKPDFDEYGVQRENTKLDNFLKRDSIEYMRLQGSEKTLFKDRQATTMFEKQANGKYKVIKREGTLVLTSRRLTFSVYSPRRVAANIAMTPLIGTANYRYGFIEKDYIIFSYPTFLLLGKLINRSSESFWTAKGGDVQWIIEDENVKFEIPRMQDENIDDVNNLLSLALERFIYKMMFVFKDSELYPKWEEFYETDDKELLLKNLLKENSHFKFKKPTVTWTGISLKDDRVKNQNQDNIESPTNPEKLERNIQGEKQSSISDELEKLALLKEKGILTDKEFSAAKAKILNS